MRYLWNEPERAQALGQERAQLDNVVVNLDELESGISDAGDRNLAHHRY